MIRLVLHYRLRFWSHIEIALNWFGFVVDGRRVGPRRVGALGRAAWWLRDRVCFGPVRRARRAWFAAHEKTS